MADERDPFTADRSSQEDEKAQSPSLSRSFLTNFGRSVRSQSHREVGYTSNISLHSLKRVKMEDSELPLILEHSQSHCGAKATRGVQSERLASSLQSPVLVSETDTSFGDDQDTNFAVLSYTDFDTAQSQGLEQLMKTESSWRRSCLHKGLVANIFFLVVMVVGVVLAEVFFPLEGVRGQGITVANDSMCLKALASCITVRTVRAIGVSGFLGGVTNWIAIEMLFRNIPLLIGTGVIEKHYRAIRESIQSIVVSTLFDPMALKEYFSGGNPQVRRMLNLEAQFGSLLDSEVASSIIDRKIDSALARPEGFMLAMMGVDLVKLKAVMRKRIQRFISRLSPTILENMAAQSFTDTAGLQAEVETILEDRIEDLSAKKVKELVSVMIRKHLSWLVVWGNIFGVLFGLTAEVFIFVNAWARGQL